MSSFPLALDRLKKLNRLIIENKELADFFIFGEYNFLQAYQVMIFYELVSCSNNKNYRASADEESSQTGLAIRIRQLFAIGVSFLSYVFLILSRRTVLIFTADKNSYPAYKCDFRMVNLFRYLFVHKIQFVEIFHTIFREDFISCAMRRRRPVFYLEAVDVIYKFAKTVGFLGYQKLPHLESIDFSSMGTDSELFRGLIEKYADRTNRSLFRIRFLSSLLKYTGIKTLFATADLRNYHEVIAACNMTNIKTYAFQSGGLSKYSVGVLDYGGPHGRIIKPNTMMLESGYWKKELFRWGTYFKESEVEVGGNSKEDYKINTDGQFLEVVENDSLTILIPYEIIAPKEEILGYIRKFLSFPGVTVIFKFRAERDLDAQVREYGLEGLQKNITLITNLKEISDFDIAAGTYSTFLYEMIGRLKPVVMLKTSLDYGESLTANRLVEEIDINDQNLLEKLKEIKHTNIEVLRARQNKLYGEMTSLTSTLDKILKKQ